MNNIKKVSHFFKRLFQLWFWLLPIMTIGIWIFSAHPEMAGKTDFGISVMPHFIKIMHPLSFANRLTGFAIGLIPLAISMLLFFYLIQLFKLYEQGKIFLIENARLIRKAGIMLLLGQLIRPVYEGLISASMTWQNPIGHRTLMLSFTNTDLGTIIIAVIVILISWIMLEACKLQEEQQLTV